ncbi:MAG: YraN family protein [Betaproteobacteria bacterium]
MRADATPHARRRAGAGARSEDAAAQFLETQGLTIIERNFRTRRGEIDLIARDGPMLVFVEVRLRTSSVFGGAAASITGPKRARMIAAAGAYLSRLGREPPCRFDAVLFDGTEGSRLTWERNILDV